MEMHLKYNSFRKVHQLNRNKYLFHAIVVKISNKALGLEVHSILDGSYFSSPWNCPLCAAKFNFLKLRVKSFNEG